MTITNGYITVQEAQDYTGVNLAGSTALLEDVVTASSRLIDEYCGRHFYSATAIRYFDTDDSQVLTLGPFNDLASVTSITEDTDGDGLYATTYTASEYQLGPVGAATRAPIAEPFTELRLLDNVTSRWLYLLAGVASSRLPGRGAGLQSRSQSSKPVGSSSPRS